MIGEKSSDLIEGKILTIIKYGIILIKNIFNNYYKKVEYAMH